MLLFIQRGDSVASRGGVAAVAAAAQANILPIRF